MATLTEATEQLTDTIARRAVAAVVAGADDGEALSTLGRRTDRWVYGSPSTRSHPYDEHVALDGALRVDGVDEWPVVSTSAPSPAFPGDHSGDQCDVVVDHVDITVSARTVRVSADRRTVRIVVAAPGAAPTTGVIRAAAATLRAAAGLTIEEARRRAGGSKRAAVAKVAAIVRRTVRDV